LIIDGELQISCRAKRSANDHIAAGAFDGRFLAENIGNDGRLKQHWSGARDAKQVLVLAERELLLPLDRLSRQVIGLSGRRVLVVTSLSPAAILTVSFVAFQNFRMLRCLATVYGGRPSFLAILRLLRLIVGHLAVTGGIAFTEDLLHQFLGQGLTARLSRRLREFAFEFLKLGQLQEDFS
jgi:putative membrane protein